MTIDTPSLAAREVLDFIAYRLLMAGDDRTADEIYAALEERASQALAPSMSPALCLVYDADTDPSRCEALVLEVS